MTAGSTQERQNADIKSRATGSTSDLAADTPTSRLDHVLLGCHASCPASRNVIALMGLGIDLIVLPPSGVMVSAQAEPIGGN
jgi:hypothetical protein